MTRSRLPSTIFVTRVYGTFSSGRTSRSQIPWIRRRSSATSPFGSDDAGFTAGFCADSEVGGDEFGEQAASRNKGATNAARRQMCMDVLLPLDLTARS